MLRFSRTKTLAILIVTLLGLLFALPNLLPASVRADLPSWLPHRTMTLGLDLQGGSYLLLEVDSAALRKERAAALREDVRQVLRDKHLGYVGLRASSTDVQFHLRQPSDRDAALTALRKLAQPISSSIIAVSGQTDLSVSANASGLVTVAPTDVAIDQRVRSAVAQSIEIIRRRIDQLGTTEPTIEAEGADRILVQVPGLQDPQRLKTLLGKTAKLTFRLVDVTHSVQAAVQGNVPPDDDLLYSNTKDKTPYLVQKRVMVSGEQLTDAQPGFDQQTNQPIVSFRFNSGGAR